MSIIDLDQIKAQLRIDDSDNDDVLEQKIAAAQNHLERLLGFKIEETYGGDGQDPIPPALTECVLQLAAHWYENRQSVLVGETGQEMPIGFADVVNEFRNWSWADAE